jgi:uncharacterized protein
MLKLLKYITILLIFGTSFQNIWAQPIGGTANSFVNSVAEQQFFTAVRKNAVASVEHQLKTDLYVNALDAQFPHNSALHWAVWENADDVLSVLLNQTRLNIDIFNGVNETPLMIAALKGRIGMVAQLLAAGAYPNKEGWTALHYAATDGHVQVIKLLLDAHAYIDAESPNKTTPLMMAVRSKSISAVKLLLDEGADVTLKNTEGWTAQAFAEQINAIDIVEEFQAREKNRKPSSSE